MKKIINSRLSFLILWMAICLFPQSPIQAQVTDVVKDTVTVHKSLFKKVIGVATKKRKFLLAPELGRSPQTGFYTGVYYLQLFRMKGDTDSRTSNIETYGTVTEKNQFYLTLNNTLLFDKEKYFWRGSSYISKFNEFFYGIGNNIDVNTKDLINFNYFNTLQRVTRNIRPHMFAGLQGQFNKTFNLSYPNGGLIDQYNVYGKGGSQNTGLGALFLYDSRDHVIFTRTGTYLDVSAMFFQKAFGSQYPFTNMIVDFRKFIKFYKNNVVCFQTLINYNWGYVPFRQLAMMGGEIMMRGYYPGIYRDNFMMAQQIELRIPVYKIVGIVLFAAVAEVEPSINRFCWQDIKYTYGMGLRVMFIKHERINVGGDLGFSKNTKTLSLGSGESF